MSQFSHAATADRPPAAEILSGAVQEYMDEAASDADEAARRLRHLITDEREWHKLSADQWVPAAQAARVLGLAARAEQLAAEMRALQREILEGRA
jgi:hypothetical protein